MLKNIVTTKSRSAVTHRANLCTTCTVVHRWNLQTLIVWATSFTSTQRDLEKL